jgi:hypothetical protein
MTSFVENNGHSHQREHTANLNHHQHQLHNNGNNNNGHLLNTMSLSEREEKIAAPKLKVLTFV